MLRFVVLCLIVMRYVVLICDVLCLIVMFCIVYYSVLYHGLLGVLYHCGITCLPLFMPCIPIHVAISALLLQVICVLLQHRAFGFHDQKPEFL